jgi:hypothetical protein
VNGKNNPSVFNIFIVKSGYYITASNVIQRAELSIDPRPDNLDRFEKCSILFQYKEREKSK